MLRFAVGGQEKLTGLDHGYLLTNESGKDHKQTTYFGKALAIIQSSRKPGAITIKAVADGLPESRLNILCK